VGRAARYGWAVALIAAVAVLTLGFRWTALAEHMTLERLVLLGAQLQGSATGPLWIFAAFVIAAVCGVPVMGLIVATEIVLGPWAGSVCALAAAVVSAAASFGIGRLVGPDRMQAALGDTVASISRKLARRGILAVAVVRTLPLAPFAVVNMVAGVTHIRWHQFVLGTLIGMAPGVLMLGVLSEQGVHALADPSIGAVGRLALVAVLLAIIVVALRRRARASERSHAPR